VKFLCEGRDEVGQDEASAVTDSSDALLDLDESTVWARRIEKNSPITFTIDLGSQPYQVCKAPGLNKMPISALPLSQ